MATSLPVQVPMGSAAALPHPEVGYPSRSRLAVLNASSGVMLRVLPHLSDSFKRLLLRGRAVTIDGNTLDTTLQFMLAAQRSAGVNGLVASSDVVVARTQLQKLAGMLDGGIAVGVRNLTLPGPAGSLRAWHYSPVSGSVVATAPAPVLVFFHGGGFVVGDLETHDGLCRLMCRDAGIHVLSIDYRLAPENKAPAAVDDCYAAYRWALEHAGELGADPARVAVGGDSAGGNLSAVVSQLALRDKIQLPALQLLLYPATNFAGDTRSKTLFADGYFLTKKDMDWFRDTYLTGASVDVGDPRISPLLAEDLSGLPPAIVVTGGFDPLRDEGNQYAAALSAAGVVVDHREFGSLVHGFANFFPLGGGSATAMTEIVSAVRAHLSRT